MAKLSSASTFYLFGKILLAQIMLGSDYSGSVYERITLASFKKSCLKNLIRRRRKKHLQFNRFLAVSQGMYFSYLEGTDS